jgi:cysteine-rich repeat protein
MRLKTLSGLFVALSLALAACSSGGGADDVDCEGVSTCSVVGVDCTGDVITSCVANADGCLIESVDDCGADGLTCDSAAADPVCTLDVCSDDAACDGASDGDSFCTDDSTVDCVVGADGCLDATVVDCSAGGDVCSDSTGSAECVAACEDHPLCAGAADGDLACDGFFLNSCTAGADGCLDFAQEHCGTALCDGAASPNACGTPPVETGLVCASAIPVVANGFLLSGADFVTDFAGGINLTSTDGCQPTADAGTVGVVLSVDLLAGETVQITQTGGMDAIISVQSTCDAAGACIASADTPATFLEHTAGADETVFLIVENNDLAPADPSYAIEVFIDPSCGNGLLEPDDLCDDGNNDPGDGCAADCTPEFGFECDLLSPSTCSLFTSLGSYAAGDTINPVVDATPVADGSSDFYLITFTERVVLGGTLVAGGTGDYDFILSDEDGPLVVSAVDGDEAWEGEFVPAGTYLIEIDLFGGEASDLGYTLTLDIASSRHGAGATVAETGGPLAADASDFITYTFTEDVLVTGTLTGTVTPDVDFYINGETGTFTGSFEVGDETFAIALLAGTYQFEVNAFDVAADTYSLNFTTTALAATDLGTFAAAAAITDVVGGALVAPAFDHYLIEFSEDVLLSGLLDGNTTGAVDLFMYDTNGRIFSNDFTDRSVPAGRYIIQIRSNLDDGDVDAYNLALSTIAAP